MSDEIDFPTQLEVETAEALRFILDGHAVAFLKARISVDGPHVEQDEDEDGWSSEISVSFYRDSELIDSFVYTMWRAGLPERTTAETSADLDQDINAMLRDLVDPA